MRRLRRRRLACPAVRDPYSRDSSSAHDAPAEPARRAILRHVSSFYRDPSAPTPNVPRRIGVTALIERNGEVLVERRADNPANEWAFIGGSLGDRETILEALERELREETGFTVERASLFGLFSDPSRIIAYPDGNVVGFVSIVFRVQPAGSAAPVPSEESREMRFVDREALTALDFWPAQRPIRDAFLADPAAVVVA